MRLLRTALIIMIGVLLHATPALAHTDLAESSPADGAVVQDPPSEVILTFTEALSPGDVLVTVIDPNGDDLVAAPATVEGTQVLIPLNLAVTPGDHAVAFTVVADDGDLVSGEVSFVFDPPQNVRTPAPSPPPPTVQPQVSTTGPTPATSPSVASQPVARPSEAMASNSEAVTAVQSVGDGLSPFVGVALGIAALVAVAAVILIRFRDPDKHS
ncbi:MAG: copper resistance CopC family protein [Euzebya sp.]